MNNIRFDTKIGSDDDIYVNLPDLIKFFREFKPVDEDIEGYVPVLRAVSSLLDGFNENIKAQKKQLGEIFV